MQAMLPEVFPFHNFLSRSYFDRFRYCRFYSIRMPNLCFGTGHISFYFILPHRAPSPVISTMYVQVNIIIMKCHRLPSSGFIQSMVYNTSAFELLFLQSKVDSYYVFVMIMLFIKTILRLQQINYAFYFLTLLPLYVFKSCSTMLVYIRILFF